MNYKVKEHFLLMAHKTFTCFITTVDVVTKLRCFPRYYFLVCDMITIVHVGIKGGCTFLTCDWKQNLKLWNSISDHTPKNLF